PPPPPPRRRLRGRRAAALAAEGRLPSTRFGVDVPELVAGGPPEVGRRNDDHRVRRRARDLPAERAVAHAPLRDGAGVLESDAPAETASSDHRSPSWSARVGTYLGMRSPRSSRRQA